MSYYEKLQVELKYAPKVWLITGVAGFIGSHLLKKLLELNQNVVGLDNFSTGNQNNLKEVQLSVTSQQWNKFKLIHGDIRSIYDCKQAIVGIDYVLHQAALGSVPKSIQNPLDTHDNNVNGFLNVLLVSHETNVKNIVYASSSSVYGDSVILPKVENCVGRPLSPYAATKAINETYANAFSEAYKLPIIGLRYFNVFGPRQNPFGAYAAVIPKWINAFIRNESVVIHGDGQTSRDFCYVENIVQANLLAANNITQNNARVFNIACGNKTTLIELFDAIKLKISKCDGIAPNFKLNFAPERFGDVRHSLANIDAAQNFLFYKPTHNLMEGLEETIDWYLKNRFSS